MDKLEKKLEEAYNDLDEVNKLFDTLSQGESERSDYCIMKSCLLCVRIGLLLKEIQIEKVIKKETVCRKTNTVSMLSSAY